MNPKNLELLLSLPAHRERARPERVDRKAVDGRLPVFLERAGVCALARRGTLDTCELGPNTPIP